MCWYRTGSPRWELWMRLLRCKSSVQMTLYFLSSLFMTFEKFFAIMKRKVQSLSHVLALGEGTPEEKCCKTIEMYRKLKEKGYKYGTGYELATLGILALLPEEPELVMQDVMEVDDYLSKEKGYGFFGIGKKQRLMHAGMLVVSDYMESENNLVMNSAAIGGTISLIAAQQAAMCAAIAAASATAASSSSSS